MSLTTLSIVRKLNPPAQVCLDPEHLPAPIADRFRELVAAATAVGEAQHARDTAAPVDRDKADQVLAAAHVDLGQAFAQLAEDTAGASSSISDSANAAFVRSIGKAQEAVHMALMAVEDAQHALALSRRVQPGRPVVNVNLDSRGLRDLPRWQQLAAVRSQLREAVGGLGQADL
ncbi:hypothetical protein [Streptomyces sp. CB03911]|uniref:hypothetical protein n=1 Tax=Streptomyces sp. CB03911 TaxID=1804758 RepID=UPI00093C2C92|nr:hypothetical protein [Streptomyces sp. CB03911]OKI14238.1 hypothetical protein A6A07_13895 [Streptomyces sp. CB03911]